MSDLSVKSARLCSDLLDISLNDNKSSIEKAYDKQSLVKKALEQVRKETAREIVELMNENKITPTTYGGPHALDLYTIVNGKINDNNFLIKQRYNLEGEDE